MGKKPYKQPALATTRRKWSKRVKELVQRYDKDPFDGLGDFNPANADERAALAVARLICAYEGMKPTPPKPAKKAAKKPAKKKPVAKQTKRNVQPAATVVVMSPSGHEHVLDVDPGLSDLLADGWVIVEGATNA